MPSPSSPTGRGITVVASGTLDHAAEAGSRRKEPRRKLVLATTARQQHLGPAVDILNISSRGMLLRTACELDIREMLTIVLPEAGEKTAQIVWNSGDLFGCRFSEPLSQGELSAVQLKAQPDSKTNEPNKPREMTEETFGQRLKRLRMASSYSMVSLAKATGVTKPTLWKWETERVRPRQKALAMLAGLLGVSESYLLFGIGEGEEQVPDQAPGNLAETISASRSVIADLAGVSTDKVTIDIDFG